MRKKARLVGGLAVVMGAIGCGDGPADNIQTSEALQLTVADQIVAANGAADRDLHLIARVIRRDTNEVGEFYEPTPGDIIFSMAGRPTKKLQFPSDPHKMSSEDLFATLAPGYSLPPALDAAISRASTGQPSNTQIAGSGGQSTTGPIPSKAAAATATVAPQGPAATTIVIDAPATSKAAIPDQNLETQNSGLTSGYCGTQWVADFSWRCNGQGVVSYEWCTYDQYGDTGGYWMTNGWEFYTNVCPETGSVLLSAVGEGGGQWTVFKDTYRIFSHVRNAECHWYWPVCSQPRFNETVQILQAAGVYYNWIGDMIW